MGPWQNHPRMPFGGPMRPDFSHPPFHGGFNPRLAPPGMGPNGPMIMPNGPPNPVAAGGPINPMTNMMGTATGAGSTMGGPKRQAARETAGPSNSPDTNSSWTSSNNNDSNNASITDENIGNTGEAATIISNDELPPVDPDLIEKISKDTMLSISIDNVPREIRYYGQTAVIFMRWDDPRDIGFQNGARRISIDGMEVVCSFNEDYKDFTYDGEVHK